MLSIPESILEDVGETIYKVSADEHMRQLLEAREDAIRNELDVQYRQESLEKELNAAQAELAKKDAALAKKDAALAKKDAALADKDAKLDAAYELLRKHSIDPNEASAD